LKEQLGAPVAEQVTVVVPIGKIVPEAGEHITGPQVPTAVGRGNVTTVPLAIGQEAAAATVWSGGQMIDPPTGTELENSEVLPMGSVAVEVTSRQLVTATFRVVLNEALPLESVLVLTKPRNCCPSVGRPNGSASLAKNSMRNVELGVLLSVPAMVVMPPLDDPEVNTGKFSKLLGSLAAPWPLESLGVRPSSLGKMKLLVRSMPSSGVGVDDAVK